MATAATHLCVCHAPALVSNRWSAAVVAEKGCIVSCYWLVDVLVPLEKGTKSNEGKRYER